jgi:N6-L-threonylcarbamoyladenine synthase
MIKIILAIETSCDETSIAVLKSTQSDSIVSFETLSHITLTQATMHAEYGGVYPNMARREHQANIVALIAEALDKAGLLDPSTAPPPDLPYLNYLEREEDVRPSLTDFVVSHPQPIIDAITVTTGPGLEPALWVGVNVARALADYWNLPLVPVNHMEGHILSFSHRAIVLTFQPSHYPHSHYLYLVGTPS